MAKTGTRTNQGFPQYFVQRHPVEGSWSLSGAGLECSKDSAPVTSVQLLELYVVSTDQGCPACTVLTPAWWDGLSWCGLGALGPTEAAGSCDARNPAPIHAIKAEGHPKSRCLPPPPPSTEFWPLPSLWQGSRAGSSMFWLLSSVPPGVRARVGEGPWNPAPIHVMKVREAEATGLASPGESSSKPSPV